MSKNSFGKQVKIEVEKRFLFEETNNDESVDSTVRPLSLSAGPTLIWLHCIGNIEARAIVDEYRPRFHATIVSREVFDSWQ